ncbi:CobQ/CobB/MinD/ParA family nucleotide binding protein [Thioalkalivibrio sp. ALE21]|uniref:KGGVGR-motif variant AAA ATPase n=1 Tax=Thioalkalivibrio sp. ALE21 TaxID=1158175 RepID=UPI000D94B70E|nr:AAA family ATPase [Thioalkalivibrio sp. ALE21]PYG03670.1 CobQ/CobB/MinD/ParA family nucleotide binding protein [Thioalkalivibrio sp. ALE21]
MVRFHDALQIAESFACERLARFKCVYAIRDLLGRVSLAVNVSAEELPERAQLSGDLNARLGRFAPGADEAVQTRDDLLMPEEVFESPEWVGLDGDDILEIRLVDRLMNNQDWLRTPVTDQPPLPTAVAFSLKGGVGRSTTLAAWAHHLAGRGMKVLVVDLDLEAPGVQNFLLGPRREAASPWPDYGVVDWLVEGRVGQADRELFEGMLGSVELAPGTPGEIRLAPAFGSRTRDYVAKLGRAYLSVRVDGAEYGFAEAVHALLQTAADRIEPFDVALLDARAGMHDIGAAAVTRLGAHAFLFARDDPPTWAGYEQLFRHLRWSPAITFNMPDTDLRWRLSTVGAMAGSTPKAQAAFRERSYETWQWLYDEEAEAGPSAPEEEDEGMPHWPIPVYADTSMSGATFNMPAEMPVAQVLDKVYGEFFRVAGERLKLGVRRGEE